MRWCWSLNGVAAVWMPVCCGAVLIEGKEIQEKDELLEKSQNESISMYGLKAPELCSLEQYYFSVCVLCFHICLCTTCVHHLCAW